jgi:hypothetical protein
LPALDILKSFDLDKATVSLWLFKKSVAAGGNPSFNGRWVDTTGDLDNALKAAVSDERDRIEEVQEYSLLAQNNEASALEPDPKGAGRLSSAVIHRAGINRAGDSACGRESIEQSIVSLASAFPAI